ncbi:hypothetical protein PR003_g11405 [Phytophthora rubi]|uniref:Uncharacterized protein n=1 Tax=Phytophthora rubi TaxID=129364 RepID=A0A6A4FLG5_9STRA|nr:hypothetical protein PR002_g3057 [Phytophthora rubi]KAE9049494.1 hypothetical protein PR001_g3267 [Phytophthora rubi]KAE9338626.1 hypothetical protein PR003_g11405 [Phytophthora rubi]
MQEGVAPGESVLVEVFQSQDKGEEKNCKRKARACRKA